MRPVMSALTSTLVSASILPLAVTAPRTAPTSRASSIPKRSRAAAMGDQPAVTPRALRAIPRICHSIAMIGSIRTAARTPTANRGESRACCWSESARSVVASARTPANAIPKRRMPSARPVNRLRLPPGARTTFSTPTERAAARSGQLRRNRAPGDRPVSGTATARPASTMAGGSGPWATKRSAIRIAAAPSLASGLARASRASGAARSGVKRLMGSGPATGRPVEWCGRRAPARTARHG